MARRPSDNKGTQKRAMDETAWGTSNDPEAMLRFLNDMASMRKLRLFAAACCRLVWGFLIEPVSQQAVQLAELAADGRPGTADFRADLETCLAGHLELSCLAILADALDEAGCSDSAVLDHLRGPGPHVRGCWALDLVLDRV